MPKNSVARRNNYVRGGRDQKYEYQKFKKYLKSVNGIVAPWARGHGQGGGHVEDMHCSKTHISTRRKGSTGSMLKYSGHAAM